MAYDRDTVDALGTDTGDELSGTVMSESQFDAIVDDLEKGWHKIKTDAQPYAQGNDTTGAIDFGPGGAGRRRSSTRSATSTRQERRGRLRGRPRYTKTTYARRG